MREQEDKDASKLTEHSVLVARVNELEKGEEDLKLKLSSVRDRVFELQEENVKRCVSLHSATLIWWKPVTKRCVVQKGAKC